jgi:cytidylate kinase
LKRVITIDGPSGAGKSTISKLLASELGFRCLDTGALYRAVGLYLDGEGIPEDAPDEEIEKALQALQIRITDEAVIVNGRALRDELRSPRAGHLASVFSAKRPVRQFLLGPQRAFAEQHDTVAEGRDMGTVVFPDAWLKFYLDASVEERAKRRYLQLKDMGKEITMEEAIRDVQDRDRRDSERAIAPLRVPDDAIYINTTGLSKEETLKRLLQWVSSRQ